MKQIIAAILLVAMTLMLCACGSDGETGVPGGAANGAGTNAPANNSGFLGGGLMNLTKKEVLPESAYIAMEGVVVKREGGESDRVQILRQDGTAVNDKWYEAVDEIISLGVCAVRVTDDNGDPRIGIVDANAGKELLPCEAIEINWMSERFLLVNYLTEKSTGGNSYGSYYTYTDMNSVEYNGYGKILDLQTGAFVPGIEVTNSEYDASAFGNMLVIDNADYEQDVYKADGTLVGSYDRFYPYPDSGMALHYTQSGVNVYDADMNLLSTVAATDNEDFDLIDGVSDMMIREFEENGEDLCCLTDLQGNPLSPSFADIEEVMPEGFMIVEIDGTAKTVDFAGNVLVNGECMYVAPGYLIEALPDSGYCVYDTTGKKLTDTVFSDCTNLLLETNDSRFFIYETGELIYSDGYVGYLTGTLAIAGSDIYDLVTGDVVMRNVDDAVVAGDNLYVLDWETNRYTCYHAEFK